MAQVKRARAIKVMVLEGNGTDQKVVVLKPRKENKPIINIGQENQSFICMELKVARRLRPSRK